MLPLLTDDVERWEVGAPRPARGKKEFEQEMRPGPDVVGLQSDVARVIEEGDAVVAEGTVRVNKKDGSTINVRFCTIFDFDGERVKRLTAFAIVV